MMMIVNRVWCGVDLIELIEIIFGLISCLAGGGMVIDAKKQENICLVLN